MSTTPSQQSDEKSTVVDQAERDYFRENAAPATLDAHSQLARAFIAQHAQAHRRVVLITSGGTTVPLERQTVRFIDNFSAGTRGATSAEYFLEAGYAVIFLHRQFSLLPYSRHYSHSTDCFLDFLQEGEEGRVLANDAHREKMITVLRRYNAARSKNLLLMLPFTTINDYLFVLRSISQLMQPLGPNGLLYLAAAVSDFFVPPERMVEHKIQSTNATEQKPSQPQPQPQSQPPQQPQTEEGTAAAAPPSRAPATEEDEAFDNFDSSPRVPRSKRLIVDLDPVPKFLKNLVDGWAPEGMIVSFKLETDPALLIHKAAYSLDRYQHHLVIGNLLATRKWEVVFVSRAGEQWIRVPRHRRKKTVTGLEELVGRSGGGGAGAGSGAGAGAGNRLMDGEVLPEGEPDMEIESLIIPAVEEMHTKHIEGAARRR